MKFLVRRTSLWNDEMPCEGLIMEKYDRIEVRTLKSPKQFDKKFAKREGTWLSKGVDHCVNEQGYIQRTHKDDCVGWSVEINTLEELVEFKSKVENELVITSAYGNTEFLAIEIYDDYRE